ncbi:hypothetical protein C6A85_000000107605, partial [Mycobacterium sp. ITM-2017-0098]
MDAVLGLSVTPTSVGLVLVGGQNVDEITLGGDGFEVRRRSTAVQTSERAAAAVRRGEALAADHGRRVHSIGVTWSDDADAEATLLLKSLSDSGFDNIVPVRLSEATDALARRIAQMLDYQTTAVCVIEPEQIIALVATDDGAVQTAVNHSVVTEDDLVGWLSSVFAQADWEPEALVLVGSAEDLDGLLPVLEDSLDVPVFSPDEAQLALARGAALACAQPTEFSGWAEPDRRAEADSGASRFTRVPAAMLATGVVTFVVSVSVAVAMQLAPEHPAPQPRPAAETSAQLPVAPRAVPVAPPLLAPSPEVAVPEVAPVVEEPPAWEPPPVPEQ